MAEGTARAPGAKPRTLLVLPCYNEKGKIGTTIRGARKEIIDEVVVVDDGSTDGSPEEARAAGATVIVQERNRGVGAALRAGFDYGRSRGYEVLVVMGGDNQDLHAEMDGVVGPIYAGTADFVQGSRRLGGALRAVQMPLFRRVTTWMYSRYFGLMTGFPATDGTNGYRAFSTRLLEDPRIQLGQDWLDRYELEPYLFYQAIRCGYRVVEAPVTKVYHTKEIGYTKMVPIVDYWRIARPVLFLRLGIRR